MRLKQPTKPQNSEGGDAYEELALRKDWVAIREDRLGTRKGGNKKDEIKKLVN